MGYKATVAGGVADRVGNRMGADYNWFFTTGASLIL